MAKASWLNVTPTQGSGTGAVTVSTSLEHTGREARTTTLTWVAANVEDVTRRVIQKGKEQFVSVSATVAAEQKGQRVTISGKSNAKMLYFSLGQGNLDVELPRYFKANTSAVDRELDKEIASDPGKYAQYDFSITIDVPKNNSINELHRQIIVIDDAGNDAVCKLISTASAAYVEIPATEITLEASGAPVTIIVNSNTSWSVQ